MTHSNLISRKEDDMPKNSIFENDDIVLWVHTDFGIIHHEVKRPIMGDRLKTALDFGYDYLKKNRLDKWLSDDRKLGPFSREDQKWCEDVWFPKTRDAGWQYWGIVLPDSVLGQMSLQYFETKYSDQGIIAEFFNNADAALAWLTEQHPLFSRSRPPVPQNENESSQ